MFHLRNASVAVVWPGTILSCLVRSPAAPVLGVAMAPYYQMTWEDKWVVGGGGGLAQFLQLTS